jgi:hypothetical protein
MSITWFKLHHELPDDIKLRRFTPQEKWAWVALLCLASKGSDRGKIAADNDDIGEYCEFNCTQDWLYFRDKLIAKGMLEIDSDGNLSVLHWEERQYDGPSAKPDAVKARVAKHRAKKKAEKEEGGNAPVTSGNADVTTQIRLDTDQIRLDPEDPSLSSGSNAEQKKEFEPSEREAALPFVQNLPQGLFPTRAPIAIPVTPTFQGPWGVGCTPAQVQFDEWLQSEATKKGMRDPSAYAFKIIDSIAKGGPTGKWSEFLSATGQAPAATDPTSAWADELRCRLAKDSDHTMVGRAWCNESEGQERVRRRQFLTQFLKEYVHAKQAS